MNKFERTAIFTMIESLEGQLRGLKSLIAASGGADAPAAVHKSTPTLGGSPDDPLSEAEEDALAQQLIASRETLIRNMGTKAQGVFEQGLAGVIGGLPKPDNSVPSNDNPGPLS